MRRVPYMLAAAMLASLLLASTIGVAVLAGAKTATGADDAVEVETFVPAITFPVAMAFAPDGTLFVNERFVGNTAPITGAIRVVSPDGAVQATPFAVVDLAEETPVSEKGLLGLALDPEFESNHFLYVYRTAAPDDANANTHGEIIRYTAVRSEADWIGAEMTILVDDLPVSAGCCHNGGVLAFGPDDKLYLSIGDNGVPGYGQDLSTAASAILRFNADGSVPDNNPFTQNREAEPAIYAYGIRNSFGMTWRPSTGEMYATENGPNCNDELNRIVAGGNYGWSDVSCEPHPAPFIPPLWILDPPQGLTGAAFFTRPAALQPTLYMVSWSPGNLFEAELLCRRRNRRCAHAVGKLRSAGQH